VAEYYYEINDSFVEQWGSKYITVSPRSVFGLAMHAERVWLEDDTGIRYVKNRVENPKTAQVDLQEFMWVKLSSKNINR
jgi:hypothetical protein